MKRCKTAKYRKQRKKELANRKVRLAFYAGEQGRLSAARRAFQ